jgi:hypothetical protein
VQQELQSVLFGTLRTIFVADAGRIPVLGLEMDGVVGVDGCVPKAECCPGEQVLWILPGVQRSRDPLSAHCFEADLRKPLLDYRFMRCRMARITDAPTTCGLESSRGELAKQVRCGRSKNVVSIAENRGEKRIEEEKWTEKWLVGFCSNSATLFGLA